MKKIAALALLAVLAGQAGAVNKCTGADGKVTYQEKACDVGGQKLKIYGDSPESPAKTRSDKTPNLSLKGPDGSEPLLNLYRRWADAERLAMTSSRIALAGPAANMQAIQREVEVIKVPQCVEDAKKQLVALVTKSTEAILQFMAKEEVTSMVYQAVDKRKLITAFETAIGDALCK